MLRWWNSSWRSRRQVCETEDYIRLEDTYNTHNYHPLDVVLQRGEGVWVWDVEGKRYLDCLSAYSALNQGHRHPRIIRALVEQAGRLTLTSRAFRNDQAPLLAQELCQLTGQDLVLPMNSGAEAVETAVKAARLWGYRVKGIPDGEAEIIACENNFHGRTITAISFSTEPRYRDGFGPFTPGFKTVPFGDAGALEAAITPNTAAFLVEPIQGEAGVIVPPDGYLKEVREICTHNNVLLVADEIQTGLGADGTALRLRLGGCDAGPDDDGQSTLGGHDAGLGGRRLARGDGPLQAGDAWLDVWGQPSRLRGRAGVDQGHRRGGASAQGQGAGVLLPQRTQGAQQP